MQAMRKLFVFIISISIIFHSLPRSVNAEYICSDDNQRSEIIDTADNSYLIEQNDHRYSITVLDKSDQKADIVEYDTVTDTLYLNGVKIPFAVSENIIELQGMTLPETRTIVTGAEHTIRFNIDISQTGCRIATIVALIIAVKTFAAGLAAGGISLALAKSSFKTAISKAITAAGIIITGGDMINSWIGKVSGKFVFTQQVDGNRCRNIRRSYSVTIAGKTKSGTWPDGDWFYTSQPV